MLHKVLCCWTAALLAVVNLAACGDDGGGDACKVDSCTGHGTCDDSSGSPLCTCVAGYTGTACDTCDNGYQDNDDDGDCLPDCATAALDCGGHGSCEDTAGEAACACDTGYRGRTCGSCEQGYQDFDGDDTCNPTCETAGLTCDGNGICDDSSGTATCECADGYTGEDCDACATGYQDNDSDGSCLPDCALAAPECGDHGACDDADGEAACACDPEYAGEACDACAEGYQDNDLDGLCTADCTTAGMTCSGNGVCDDTTGTPECECDEGHLGDDCESCAFGYQDNDGDGHCLPACVSAGLDCSGHGDCDDSSGTPVCACDLGYVGADCSGCDAGYQDNDGNGSCLPDCASAGLACVHGTCDDASGQAHCECDATWGGALCDVCAGGFQDNDGNDTCEPTCAAAEDQGLIDCTGHTHCDDSSGTATCVCDEGHTGADCDQCDTGYHDPDGDGLCRPTCATAGYDVSCLPEGVCDDSTGEAMCICNDPYVHDGQGHCVPPSGEDCSTAIPLDLGAGSVTGSTVDAGGDTTASCVGSDSEERVYVFTLGEDLHVTFTSTGFDTVLHMRTDCEDAGTEIACNDDGGPGTGSMLDEDLTAGTYYLFVDGYGSNVGDYTLTIEVACSAGFIFDPDQGICVDDPCDPNPCSAPNQSRCQPVLPDTYTCLCDFGYIDDPDNPGTCIPNPDPQGETCVDFIPITPVDGSVAGDTTNAQADDTGGCGGVGPDHVYGFTLAEAMRVDVLSDGYDTVLYLRTICDDPDTEVACDDEGGAGGGSHIVELLGAGTYYLWLDSFSSSGGDYTLTYSFRTDPCATDPCPGTPECVAFEDWSGFECVCPVGTIPYDNDCVDDPCDPNPCAQPNQGICIVDDPPFTQTCACNIGYIDDGGGICIEDPAAKEWLYMVYVIGDNNYSADAVTDVGEMSAAGSTADVDIVVLLDTQGDTAKRLYVEQGSTTEIEDIGEINMLDWQNLRDFGVWAMQTYPARHIVLSIWDIGAGWRSGPGRAPVRGFIGDYDPGPNGGPSELRYTNGDYTRALSAIAAARGTQLDMVVHDASLMGMWEVAEATAPYAHTFTGSEELISVNGLAYDSFLGDLVADPSLSVEDLATAIVDSYISDSTGNTYSAIDLDTLGDLTTAVSGLADVMVANADLYAQIDSIRAATQAFNQPANIDLLDFAQGISAMAGAPSDLVTAADALAAQLAVTILHNGTSAEYAGATGMAIYLPAQTAPVDPDYTEVGAVWSQNSTWDDFLLDFDQ